MKLTPFRLKLLELLIAKEGTPVTTTKLAIKLERAQSQISLGLKQLKEMKLINYQPGFSDIDGKLYEVSEPAKQFTH